MRQNVIFILAALVLTTANASRARLGPRACTDTLACGEEDFGLLGNPACVISTDVWAQYWEFQGTAGRR